MRNALAYIGMKVDRYIGKEENPTYLFTFILTYRFLMICYFIILSFLHTVFLSAANITATLDSADGTSGFVFNDSGSTQMAIIDSDGNLQIKGGLRIDSGGIKCTTAEMLIVDGRIGIGIANPSEELEIAGGRSLSFDSNLGRIKVKGDAGGWSVYFGVEGNAGTDHGGYGMLGNADALTYYWIGRAYDDADIVVRDFNVGIGTSTPNETLEVEGAISMREKGAAPSNEANYGKLYVKSADNLLYFMDDGGTEYSLTQGGDFKNGGEAGGADRSVGNTDNFDLSFLTNNQTRLHIQNDGKIGIGTQTPGATFEISGNNNSMRITSSNIDGGQLEWRSSGVTRHFNVDQIQNGTEPRFRIFAEDDAGDANGVEIVSVEENGTSGTLEVNGNIIADNMWMKVGEVDLTNATGYTFTGLNGNIQKMYKVFYQGRITSGGTDRRMYVRVNGATSGYLSWARYEGGAAATESDTSAFYCGRTGWSPPWADVMVEYTVGAVTGWRRSGFGKATFVHDDNTTLFYGATGGVWTDTTSNITSLWFGPNGGTMSGKLMLFALQ